jgi:YD repeat-containing protein
VIAVLCSKTEQSTTDVNGSQGLTPTLESGVPSRVWSYTYNADGQVLTVNGPRTDVTDTTTYEYYPAEPNPVGHAKGDLKKVTNALGKVTQYTEYDKAGRVLTMIDPNQVTTTMTYWPRGWLKTSSVGGQATTYDYWPTGLLKRVTQPDNVSYVDYTYDDAHRLSYVSDNLGNRIDYTLDNAGNRKEEKVSDPSGALSRQLTRIIDALGRVEQTTGSE